MESLNMKPKNDSMSNIETTSLLAVSSELFSLINIITLPDEANYSYQEFLNVLLHAATSSTNSLESASNDLRSKIPNIRIPSADTIFNYIKPNYIENILSSFRKINCEVFRMIDLKNKVHDLSLIHISEPTRQAESSYAVFCLKKKKIKFSALPPLIPREVASRPGPPRTQPR